ncbi:MAG: ketopantoate reductase family protein [Thermoflexales bacterium]|nr:ketopantoate reductase family protein [Thermoflexales bacterium]
MRIVVIGAGAIGGYVGGKLAMDGHTVTMVDRPALVEAIQTGEGLRVIEPGSEQVAKVHATVDLAEAFGSGSTDLVLFTVKGYDTAQAIEELKPYDAQFSRLLSLQNGISNESNLAEAFGAPKVLAGTITHPVSTPRLGTVRSEKKRGGVVIAPLTPQSVDSLVDAFNAAGIHTYTAEDAQALKWSKLLLNIIGNASAAILDMSSTQVFHHPGLVDVEIAALREALAVMKAKGIYPIDLPGYPARLLAWSVRYLPPTILRPVLRWQVVRGRREKLPSLLIEMRRETGRSEIEDLNGAVARAGKEAGVPTPANEMLTTTLSMLVRNPDQRVRWREQPNRLVAIIKKAAQ